MANDPTKVKLEVWQGVEGLCLLVCNKDDGGSTRVAGPKMWGGSGNLLATFYADHQELINALARA